MLRRKLASVKHMESHPEVKHAVWGAVGGAVIISIVGLWGLGWTLGSTAERMARDRAAAGIVDALTPVCVVGFRAQTDAAAKHSEFNKISTSRDRQSFIEKGGWATTPGSAAPNADVATACAEKRQGDVTSIYGDAGMTPEELRLECLKLELQGDNASGIPVETGQLVSPARAYADFVLGHNGHVAADINGAPVGEATLRRYLRRTPASQFESSVVQGLPHGAG
jgi:hypothetical protein